MIDLATAPKKAGTGATKDDGVRRMDISRMTGSDADAFFAALVG
jgi:hypothetical protein